MIEDGHVMMKRVVLIGFVYVNFCRVKLVFHFVSETKGTVKFLRYRLEELRCLINLFFPSTNNRAWAWEF